MSNVPNSSAAPVVRTRFAPSPTGEMHIGGFRTVFYSWLLARKYNGQFILRIEDTDQVRSKERVIDNLIEGFNWLSLNFDEGPAISGQYGPYYQSDRLGIYAHYAAQVLEKGHVYPCFCSEERLDTLRQEQQKRGLATTGYDRKCRNLPEKEAAQRMADGEPFVLRLKVPLNGFTVLQDALRGEMKFNNALLEDSVMIKSDGYPTYHFASIIDDHLMKISHILRGDDWLPSFPLHGLLYTYLGWEMPVIAHVPNVLGDDGKKLSKRHGAEPVLLYKGRGYLPEAILNFLALLGWAYDEQSEIFTVDELIDKFSLERVHTSPAKFDTTRLLWMNGIYIRKLSIEELVKNVLPFLEAPEADGGLPDSVARPLDRAYLRSFIHLDQERMKTFADAAFLTAFFFVDDLEYLPELLIDKKIDAAGALCALHMAYNALTGLATWDHDSIEQALRNVAAEMGVKAGPVFMGVRVAVTGRKETPPLMETMLVLGRERCLRRINIAIQRLETIQVSAETAQ